jgi:hypothetical protein
LIRASGITDVVNWTAGWLALRIDIAIMVVVTANIRKVNILAWMICVKSIGEDPER